MDAFSLLRWGATSYCNRIIAGKTLHNRFKNILRSIVEDIDPLIEAMRSFGVIIGGTAALLFFQHDSNWAPIVVDFYVPDEHFAAFQRHLLLHHGATVVGQEMETEYILRGIKEIVLLLAPGGTVNLVRSMSDSAFFPLTQTWTTLLMNWVGPDACGSAYAQLTSCRRGLIGYQPLGSRIRKAMRVFTDRKYDFAFKQSDWHNPQYNGHCPCDLWTCPAQARHFCDSGALVARYEPFCCKVEHRRALPVPPGLPNAVIWRLSAGLCLNGCHQSDLLAEGVLSFSAA